MIQEWVSSLFATATATAKQNGLLKEAMAYEARAARQEQNWKSHWLMCHKLVQEFLANQHNVRLLILGSGSLFEIPLERIEPQLEACLLVDQVFPLSVKLKIRSNRKFTTLSADLSAPDTISRQQLLDFNPTHILSSNLLSQLSVFARANKESALGIENGHWSLIRSFKKPVLIWSDFERIFVDLTNPNQAQTDSSLQHIPKDHIQEWTWNLAPSPELKSGVDYTLRVRAWKIEKT